MRKRQMEGAARVDMRDYAVFSTEKRWGNFLFGFQPCCMRRPPRVPALDARRMNTFGPPVADCYI